MRTITHAERQAAKAKTVERKRKRAEKYQAGGTDAR